MSFEELSKRYLTISQSEKDAIITSDKDKTIQSWNLGAEKIFGYQQDEVLDKSIEILIPERYRARHDEGMTRILRGGEERVIGKTVELTALHKDGREFPIELTLGFWQSENETFFSAIIRDITERKESERLIQLEKKKADNLLQNILPSDVIHELKQKGKVQSKHYPDVTVLFTDIVGFTRITETYEADKLVSELNIMFSHFDKIVKRRGLEKIKTIGDSYMCAGGIPLKNNTHAVDAVLAAIQMLMIIKAKRKERPESEKDFWNIRLGIHSGPVMAGVVGEWKYTYDIWGDTVNVASRMESSGLPGFINISQNTYQLVQDFFDCLVRNKIDVKNKGEMEMYVISGIKKELSIDNKGRKPNNLFYDQYKRMKLQETE